MSNYIQDLVSVIIPTYKRADKIERAIESVLNQTYQKLEVLVVNDNEPGDEYTLKLEEIISSIKDPRVSLIHQEKHINGAAARNTGIRASKGEYIAFLDDDDTWIKNKIEKQIDIFNKNPDVGLVTTGVYYKYVKENITYTSIPNVNGDVSKEILISNCIGGTQVMVKKYILDKVGGFDEKLKALQDYELWIRVCQFTKVATVNSPCINYFNYRGTNQISQFTKNYETSFNYISKKHSKLIKNLSVYERKRMDSAKYLLLANKAMRNNDKKLAFKYGINAFKINPSVKSLSYIVIANFSYKTILRMRKKTSV